MTDSRQWIPIGGLLATIAAASYGVVHLHGQAQPRAADYTKAATVQVKNAQGQVVLQGDFQAAIEDDGGFERRASLVPTGVDADAVGEAEVEFAGTTSTRQEVEFTVRNVGAGATFTFVIDGVDVASAKSDARGRVDIDFDVP
jgi:hypothetical protein